MGVMGNERTKYYESIEELLQYCDSNFKSSEDNQCTLLMTACALNEYYLIELIMNRDFTKSSENKKEPIKCFEKDINSRNILHYLLTLDNNHLTMFRQRSEYNSELNILNILQYLTQYIDSVDEDKRKANKANLKKNQNMNLNFNLTFSDLTEKDKEGQTPLSLSLMKGYYKVANYLVSKGILKGTGALSQSKENQPAPVGLAKYTLFTNGNSLLHCAIFGKNINNLYLILSHCSAPDLLQKNKDNLTPADYAKNLNLHYFYKVLKFYETNLTNPYSSKYFCSSSNFVDVSKLLSEIYCNEKYDEAVFVLEKLKLSNSLGDYGQNNSNIGISRDFQIEALGNCSLYNELTINWNIMMCQYSQLKKYSTANTLNSKQDTTIKPESIISKITSTNNNNNNSNDSNANPSNSNFSGREETLFNQMNLFFNTTIATLHSEQYSENPQLLFLLFNKIVFFHKTSNFSGCIKSCLDLLTYMKICNPPLEESFSFILFLNTCLILVDILFAHNLLFLAAIVLERIEINFLEIKFNERNNMNLDEQINKFLTSIEYLHNGTKTWDDIFCMVNLFKAMRDLHHSFNEQKKNDSAKFLKVSDELESKCKYKQSLPVFSTIRIISESIKARQSYLENSLNASQFNRILAELYNKVIKENKPEGRSSNNNSKIESKDSILESISNPNTLKDTYLFYCNAMGIQMLKQKRYHLAELHFKTSIAYYEKVNFVYSGKKDFSFAVKLGYIHIFKYNLALVYFFQKRFGLARNLLSMLSKTNNTQITTNIYLWFRLGLSCLEMVNYGFIDYLDEQEDEDDENEKNNEQNKTKTSNNQEDRREIPYQKLIGKALNYNYCQNNKNIIYNSCKSKESLPLNQQNKTNDNTFETTNKTTNSNNNKSSKKGKTNTTGNNNNNNDLSLNTAPNFESLIASSQIILVKKSSPNENELKLLNEAIYAFKKILIIINHDLKGNHLLCGKALYDLFQLFSNKEVYSDNQEFIPLINSNYKSKNHSLVIINTYLNLLFSLICLERWNEVLFYADDFEKSDYFDIGSKSSNKEIIMKIHSYKLIAYIHLRQYDKAVEISESFLSNSNNKFNNESFNDLKMTFKYSRFFSNPETSFHLAMLVNIAKMHYSNANIEEGDKVLSMIVQNFVKDKVKETDFPFYVVNLIIFTLLYKGLTDLVFQIVKYRKIYEVLTLVKLIKIKN